jgi:pimeloyl-ACP methyl ester carboxylesterase
MSLFLRRTALIAAAVTLGACSSSTSKDGPGPTAPDGSPPDRIARDADQPGDAGRVIDGPPAPEASAASSDGAAASSDGAAGGPTGDPTAGIAVAPIAWHPCAPPELGDDCGTVKAPLDYANPGGAQLDLFVARVRATDTAHRIGSLFSNPGGPGSAGVSDGFLAGLASGLSDDILARFDIVSWDPRGVGQSRAVDCHAMPTVSQLNARYDHSPGTPDRDALVAAYALWVSQCKTAASDLLPFVGTTSTVRDLELLRRAVGDEKLNYLGFSYGTAIGEHYYLRYPERVRSLVIDGVEPIWPEDFKDADQDASFDGALTGFLEWCGRATAVDCPFARETPVRAQAFDQLEAAIAAQPLPAGNGATLNLVLFKWGISNYLYSEAAWPSLAAALENARLGDGSRMARAAQGYLGSGSDQDPFYAISCGDAPTPSTVADIDAYAAMVAKLRVTLPYASLACVGWPVGNLSPPPPMPAGPLPPIVLIGTVGDPATPYRWAMATKAHLGGSATLMTAEGYTHTAYEQGIDCIDGPVNAFLINGTLPASDIHCPVDEPHARATQALRRPQPRPPRLLRRR